MHFLPGGPYTFCGNPLSGRTYGDADFDAFLKYYVEHRYGTCPRCLKALRRFTAYSIRLAAADAQRVMEYGPDPPGPGSGSF